MKTETRSPKMVSGVATLKSQASTSIVTVIRRPAINPARNPAPIARRRVMRAALPKSAFESDAKQRGDDSGPRHERASQRARHFRFATGPASMIHRHFQDPEPSAGRAHLHLEVPAV